MSIVITRAALEIAEKLGVTQEQYIAEVIKEHRRTKRIKQLWVWYQKKKGKK